jgi:hypothetical protein
MIAAIVDAESTLPAKHLIAQNVDSRAGKVAELNLHVSVVNFHAATADNVRQHYHLNKVLASDETGGSDRSDRKYRTDGWDFIVAGGGVYDHLDFSFTLDRADGTAVPLPPRTPGGGGPELRRQLRILKEFIEDFDFIRMRPDNSVLKGGRISAALTGTPPQARTTARALAEVGRAYAIYVNGGTQAELVLDLPAGSYTAEWVNTKTGQVDKSEQFKHGGGNKAVTSPAYVEDIALRVKRVGRR